jgi:hypothetical protein
MSKKQLPLLEIALFAILVINNYRNEYLPEYIISYLAASIITAFHENRFTLEKQRAYCNFADDRCCSRIPNISNVVSNGIFILAGIYDFINTGAIVFGIISIAVGLGSSYFHWQPTLETLFWDRLPMVFGMAYIIYQHTGLEWPELLLHGLYTLEYHNMTHDLMPYVIYQTNMILLLAWITGFSMPVVLYILAKICEDWDAEIYIWTNLQVSGHTLKHLFSGFAMMIAI